METQSPPSPLCPTPASCQAQHGPVLLHCIPLIPQPSLPSWGIGEEAPEGSTQEPDMELGEWGLTLQLSDVLCIAWV